MLTRLLARGRHTPRQAAVVETGRLLFAAERVPIVVRVRDFRIPGQFARAKRVLLSGSVLLTPEIVSASLRSRMLLVWLPWQPVPAGAQGGVEVRADGLHVTYDVPRIVDGGRGEVEFHYRFAPGADVLAALPTPTAPLRIDPGVFAGLCWDHLG